MKNEMPEEIWAVEYKNGLKNWNTNAHSGGTKYIHADLHNPDSVDALRKEALTRFPPKDASIEVLGRWVFYYRETIRKTLEGEK